MRYNAEAGETTTLRVPSDACGTRLDVFLADTLREPSRTFVKRLVDDGLVTVEPGRAKPAYRLKGGETVTVLLPELVEMAAEPEDLPLSVLYEDAEMIVLDKAAGMVVHPSPGHETGTLVHALLHHCADLSGIGGVLRPGIVHRLDRDTTGVIVAAKNDRAHRHLAAQFAARTTKKLYLALTDGVPRPACGRVEGGMARHPKRYHLQTLVAEGGRHSLSEYETREAFGRAALVACRIHTGRTHQIRVHMKSVGAPLLADPEYGRGGAYAEDDLARLAAPPRRGKRGPPPGGGTETPVLARTALHARRLALRHPVREEEMAFEAPLAEDMRRALAILRKHAAPADA